MLLMASFQTQMVDNCTTEGGFAAVDGGKDKFKSESEFKLRMGIGSLFLPFFARKCLFFFLTFVSWWDE